MKLPSYLLVLLAAGMMAAGCAGKPGTEQVTVASSRADCIGVAPMKCLLIRFPGESDWQFWYDGIEGFTYEPGYEYKLKIRREQRENPAADQSSLRLVLVKELSKEQKTSEGLPPSADNYND